MVFFQLSLPHKPRMLLRRRHIKTFTHRIWNTPWWVEHISGNGSAAPNPTFNMPATKYVRACYPMPRLRDPHPLNPRRILDFPTLLTPVGAGSEIPPPLCGRGNHRNRTRSTACRGVRAMYGVSSVGGKGGFALHGDPRTGVLPVLPWRRLCRPRVSSKSRLAG